MPQGEKKKQRDSHVVGGGVHGMVRETAPSVGSPRADCQPYSCPKLLVPNFVESGSRGKQYARVLVTVSLGNFLTSLSLSFSVSKIETMRMPISCDCLKN